MDPRFREKSDERNGRRVRGEPDPSILQPTRTRLLPEHAELGLEELIFIPPMQTMQKTV